MARHVQFVGLARLDFFVAGLWEFHVEQTPEVDEEEKAADGEELATVVVADITDGSHFYVHVDGDESLASVGTAMKEFTAQVSLVRVAVCARAARRAV